MKPPPSIAALRSQLDCFDRTLRPALMRDTTFIELENRITLSLHLHEAIQDFERSWGERIDAGDLPYSEELAGEIQALFAQWLKGAKRLVPLFKRAEAKGRRLAAAERLRDAIGFCYQPRINIHRTNQAFDRLERGEKTVRVNGDSHGVRHRRAG